MLNDTLLKCSVTVAQAEAVQKRNCATQSNFLQLCQEGFAIALPL